MGQIDLRSARLKLERAKLHADVFHKATQEWNDSNPDCLRRNHNVQGTRHFITVQWQVPPPTEQWGLIIADCINNVRGALDHATFATASFYNPNGIPDKVARGIYFPVASDSHSFDSMWGTLKTVIPDALKPIFEQFQVYNRSHPLFGSFFALLQRLNNTDKHRTLTVGVTNLTRTEFGNVKSRDGIPIPERYVISTTGNAGYIDNGSELMGLTFAVADPDLRYHFEADFRVVLKDPTIDHLNAISADHLLNVFRGEAEKVIAALEAI